MKITGRTIIYTLTRFRYLGVDKNLDTITYDKGTMYLRQKDTLEDCSFWESKTVSILITLKRYTILGTFSNLY